jgi:hypothetical protein
MAVVMPRMFRQRAPAHDLELTAQLECYHSLVGLPYSGQERVIKHLAEIFHERHQYRYVESTAADDGSNGM